MESDKNEKVLISRSTLTNIGDAIREKNGSETAYKPSEMPSAISSIRGDGVSGVESVTIKNKDTLTEYWREAQYKTLPLEVAILPADAPQIMQVTVSDPDKCGVVNLGDGTYGLRPYKNGKVTIMVTDYSGKKTDSVEMKIGTRATHLTMSSAKLELQVGVPRKLSYTLQPSYTTETEVEWSSSDPASVSIDQDGTVTAHKHCDDIAITAKLVGSNLSSNCLISAITYNRDPDWAAYRAAIKNGTIREMVDIGDVIVDTWTDTTANKEYEYSWIVADFRKATLEDESEVDAMYLMSKNSLPFSLSFAQNTKLVASEDTAQKGVFYYGYNGSTYVLLDIEDGEPLPKEQYANIYKTLVNYSTSSNFLNATVNGLNRWELSAARQYLNSNADAGNWFESKILSDTCSYASSRAGFLSGFSAAFQDALVPIKVQTVRNTTIYDGETDVTYDKMFLPSSEEVYMGAYSSAYNSIEGEAWEYYKKMATSPTTGSIAARAIIPLGATSTSNVWLRSAYLASVQGERTLNISGGRTDYYASYNGVCFAPACAITAS